MHALLLITIIVISTHWLNAIFPRQGRLSDYQGLSGVEKPPSNQIEKNTYGHLLVFDMITQWCPIRIQIDKLHVFNIIFYIM
jgi:hypothetical protein